jgi:hypothetical protein
MNFKKISSSLLIGTVLISSLNVAPAHAGEFCLDLWNDDCDLFTDETVPEVGEIDEMILPKTDVYVTNLHDEPIEVTVYQLIRETCSQTDGCNGGEARPMGTWTIPGNTEKVFIIDNAITLDDRAEYSFAARSNDGQYEWTPKTVDLNGTRNFTYTFN